MTSINTNLSSLIVQKNLTKSTNALNQAVERLTTGFKINHASDNAANYSISESMSSKLSSYMVAEENTSMGLDLIRTQSSTLDTIQNLTTRLRALAEQAHNGTYGAQSLEAINQEANAIIDEITRIGNNAEYNGIKLFDNAISQAGIPQLKSNGLMQEIERRDTSGMTKLADVDASSPLAAGTYSISTAEELAKLAELVNNGDSVADCEFVLGADIDLSAYKEDGGWVAIGCGRADSFENRFSGIFDGNGYTISNLYIDSTSDYGSDTDKMSAGLFGRTIDATIKNVSLSGFSIELNYTNRNPYVGCLAGDINNTDVVNCTATGNISTNSLSALLVGRAFTESSIEDCYVSGNVSNAQYAGGIAGVLSESNIENCFANVCISNSVVAGGVVGTSSAGTITNCASSGSIQGRDYVGGILGQKTWQRSGTSSVDINNSLSGSDVSSYYDDNYDCLGYVGTLVGGATVKANSVLNVSAYYDSFLSGGEEMIGNLSSNVETNFEIKDIASSLQVGVDSTDSSSIKFTTNISLSSVNALRIGGMEGANSLEKIDTFISKLSEAQTKLGAVENRLTSTIESIGVNIENLTSSRSTLKDADVAKESSQMLKNQILQQASATLLATANQTPSLALRLLGEM